MSSASNASDFFVSEQQWLPLLPAPVNSFDGIHRLTGSILPHLPCALSLIVTLGSKVRNRPLMPYRPKTVYWSLTVTF